MDIVKIGVIKMKQIEELVGKSYMTCSACMSVWADGLSWANAHTEAVTTKLSEADNIIVLSCQVTDLAVLSDLRTIEKYHSMFPEKNFFISGCLAKREDVSLPSFAERLDTPRENYQFITNRRLVNFEKPFWTPEFSEQDSDKVDGHLFRDMYPLRISKGCPKKCSYCTIRITRGDFEKLETSLLEKEFLKFDDILLIADSPTVSQIKQWYGIALKHQKPFSIRNVEPSVTVACREELNDLADKGLLKVYHSPVQSSNPEVLLDMRRPVNATLETMAIASELKNKGVYIATNIIIDYKNYSQDFSKIYALYDYVSWNPLWDGVWNRDKAEKRFDLYINSGIVPGEVERALVNCGKSLSK
jgi:tRNA A37 methylthiotransferase MiaB